MSKTSRANVYMKVDEEREYQDQKWGNSKHTPTEWLVYIRDYTEEALHILSREYDNVANLKALSNIRKITALGVACMEEHDTPNR